jgi:hypothetical protein
MLQWARKDGCPFNVFTCRDAAASENLEELQWLVANGCQWKEHPFTDMNPCAEAAKEGHLVILQWAHSNGCSWDRQRCLSIATENDQLDVMAWLNKNETTVP